MKPARTLQHIDAPYSWAQLPNGKWIRQAIQTRFNEWHSKLFGYHLLKLGGLSGELDTTECAIYHQVCIDATNPAHTMVANFDALPFLEKSFDVCVLAHQLDFYSDPHQLLREIDRVMVDDGYLIISGCNPLSSLGIRGLFPWNRHDYPWSGQMFLPMRVKDWLSVLNYEVIECDVFSLFQPTSKKCISKWWNERLTERSSSFGCFYFMVARKRSFPLKPIEPRWKLRPALSPLSLNYRTQPSNCDKSNVPSKSSKSSS